jgi:hypothetical protein
MSQPTGRRTAHFTKRGRILAGILIAVAGLSVLLGIYIAPQVSTAFWVVAPLAAIAALIVLFSNSTGKSSK